MTETKHQPALHRHRRFLRQVTHRQQNHRFSKKWTRQFLTEMLAGMFAGALWGYLTSWQPITLYLDESLRRRGQIVLPTAQPENIAALVTLLGAGYIIGAPFGVILAGRLMGQRGVVRFILAFVGGVIGAAVAILLGWLLIRGFPIMIWILLLILPPAFAAAGYQIDLRPRAQDNHRAG